LEPRGIRNNNPGNIEDGPFAQGVPGYAGSDGRFAKFDTPEAGMTAIDRLLSVYNTKHGINTVQGAISRWAPQTENPTTQYAQYVADKVGVSPTTPLDFQDAAVRQKIASGIFEFENGRKAPTPSAPAKSSISYDDMIVPPVPAHVSDAVAETIRAQHREENAPGLWQGIKDAVNTEWIVNNIAMDSPTGQAAIVDPDWRWDPVAFKEATKDIPKDYWPQLAEAHSQPHADWLKSRIAEKVEMEKRLDELGWTGTGLRLAAGFIDPAGWAAVAASEGFASPFLASTKLARAGSLLHRMAIGAVGGAGYIAARDAADLERHTATEYLMGAGLGLSMAGIFHGSTAGRFAKQTADRMDAAGKRMVAEGEAPRAVTPEAATGSTVGAARAPHTPDFLTIDDHALASIHDGDIPHTAFKWVRPDSFAVVDRNGAPLHRLINNAILEDAVGKVDGSVVNFSAEQAMRRIYNQAAATLDASWETHFQEWADTLGLNAIQKQARTGEFYELVGRYRRNPELFPDAPAPVQRMNSVLTEFYSDRLAHMQNPLRHLGEEGRPVASPEIPQDPTYLQRLVDARRIREHVERYSTERIEELIYGAIRNVLTTVDENIVRRMARAWVNRRYEQAYGLHEDPRYAFFGNDINRLRGVLADEYGLSHDDIAHVIDRLPRRGEGGGKDAFLQRRIDMDEGYSMMVQPKFGGPAERVAVADLLVQDTRLLADNYNRRTAGRIAMGQTRIYNKDGELVVNGITHDNEWRTLLQNGREQAADKLRDTGNKRYAKDNVDNVEKNLQWAYDMILGYPIESQVSKGAQYVRWLMKFNFARLMNLMGLPQLQEMGTIPGQVGFRAMFQSMPALRELRNMTAQTVQQHGLRQELENIVGLRLRMPHFNRRWDEYGADYRAGQSQLGHNVENALDIAGHVTNTISGFRYVQQLSQVWAAGAVVQKFANLAGNPTKANLRRMASLGLDEKTLNRVLSEIKSHATLEDGALFGGKVKELNLSSWRDLDARAAFENSVFRWSRRVIQENDFGSMARWMSNPLAQLLLQFRVFITHAWAKQFLHNVHMRDFNTFTTFAYTMMTGAAVYMLQEHLKSAGRGDRDQFLQKRLAPEKIAAAAWSRAGWSSFLPTAIDSVRTAGGVKPIFDNRTSGNASDFWFGNAGTGLVDDTFKAVRGLIGPTLDGRARTQEDTRNMVRPFIWQNSLPSTILMNYLTRGMPERPPRQ
jgi:hypothetical protein